MTKSTVFQGCVVAGVFTIVCFLFFRFFYPFPPVEAGQLLHAMPDAGLAIHFDKPAVLASWLGDVLNACCTSVTMAAVVLTAVLLLEWLVLVRVLGAFKIGRMSMLYALFPVMFEWVAYRQQPGMLSSTLTLIIVLLVFLIYTKIEGKWASLAFGFVMLPVIYFLAGGRLIVFSVMVLLFEAERGRIRWLYWVLLVVSGYIYPVFGVNFYGVSEEVAYLYPYTMSHPPIPAIVIAFGLLALHVRIFREIELNWKSALVVAALLLFILAIGTKGQRKCIFGNPVTRDAVRLEQGTKPRYRSREARNANAFSISSGVSMPIVSRSVMPTFIL